MFQLSILKCSGHINRSSHLHHVKHSRGKSALTDKHQYSVEVVPRVAGEDQGAP